MIYACPECGRMVSENADRCPKCGEPSAGSKARNYYDTYTRPRLEQEREAERGAEQAIEKYTPGRFAFITKCEWVSRIVGWGIFFIFCLVADSSDRGWVFWVCLVLGGGLLGLLGSGVVSIAGEIIGDRKKWPVPGMTYKEPYWAARVFCKFWVSVLTGLVVFFYLGIGPFGKDTHEWIWVLMLVLAIMAGYLMRSLGNIVEAVLDTAENSSLVVEKSQEIVDLLKATSEEVVSPGQIDFIWRRKFADALKDAGINTVSQDQLNELGDRLSLAIPSLKIDIDVVCKKYHRDARAMRKEEYFWRDMTIEHDRAIKDKGWTPIRFWVYELREDMAGCVEKIRKLIAEQQKLL